MTAQKRVLLVTSWGGACGIADHSAQLIDAVMHADPDLQVSPSAEALDLEWLFTTTPSNPVLDLIDLLHLNHHDGLHSRWTVEHVKRARWLGLPVVVTYHDTREKLEDCPKLEDFIYHANAVVIHEPMDLGTATKPFGNAPVHYWRQGVPAPAQHPADYVMEDFRPYPSNDPAVRFKAFPQQPVLGTVGFNFPWKNYDKLAVETREAGWALVLLSNNATEEDEIRWKQLNSSTLVVRGFLDGPTITNYLAGCDATAFMYECANTGTSGAIRQGIAARKPVLALWSCRQFRDLEMDNGTAHAGITWLGDWAHFRATLPHLRQTRADGFVHALAEQDSWSRLGGKYAALYRRVLAAAQ